MNRLPQEIIDHVAWWLPLPKSIPRRNGRPASPIRPSIASVSEKFRHAVERLTFHELHIKTSELNRFDEILSGARSYRRRFLTRLNVIVILPEYRGSPYPTWEFAVDREANNHAATAGMHQLLYVLSGWESDLRLELTLEAQSPSDPGALTNRQMRQRWEEFENGTRYILEHERYQYSLTEILNVDKMPFVPCVRTVHFHGQRADRSDGVAFTGEVDPSLFWPYQPLEKPEPFWQSMKKLEITMAQNSTSTEWYQRTNYNKWSQKTIARYSNIEFPVNHAGLPAPGHGSAREAKRAHRYVEAMFQHESTIEALTYRTLVHGGFRDDNDDNGSDENDNESSAQDGGNSDDAAESKYSRADEMLKSCGVNEPPMARLLDAMMKAMLQMRRLEFVRLKGCLSEMWCFEFYAPGVPSKYDAKSEATPSYARFILPKRHSWIPGEEILSGFRNMATEKYGQQPAVIWVEHIWRN
ncbi:hypothetical protein K4K59_010744 [Colletotrichum sp. SAR11_240]|nr:hypothetical protein K4K59_010744 [Colletotrichum sp. SAR11_240]